MTHAPVTDGDESGSAPIRAGRSRREAVAWAGILLVATALKVWLVRAQTLWAIAPTPLDDELFLHTAEAIANGDWLGPMTSGTLAKAPGYPLFLALNHATGVPVLVSQALVYAACCAVLVWGLRPLSPDRWRLAALYVILLFNPVTWADGPATRLIREGIYSSETILLLGLAAGAVVRLIAGSRTTWAWSLCSGLAGALVALTREEGVWLAPSVALIAFAGAIAGWRTGPRRVLAAVAIGGAAYVAPIAAVATMNWWRYGLFLTIETRASHFTAASEALTRVEVPDRDPRIPVPRRARLKLYEVSPSFRDVAPFLEESASKWARYSCPAMGVCDDIAGGWFNWAVREAASQAGKYRDGATAAAWYRAVAREVDAACSEGTLECGPPRANLLPAWRGAYVGPLVRAFARATTLVATMRDVTPRSSPPRANPNHLASFERFTREQIPRPRAELAGIVESREGEVSGVVMDPAGRPAPADVKKQRIDGTPAAGPVRTPTERLIIGTSCVANCVLFLYTPDKHVMAINLDNGSTVIESPELAWTGGEPRLSSLPPTGSAITDWRIAALTLVTRAYGLALPVLAVIAAVVLAARLRRAVRDRSLLVPSAIALAFLGAVAARLALVSLIEVFLFPAISVLYLAPAYGLLIAFAAFVLVLRWRPVQGPEPRAST